MDRPSRLELRRDAYDLRIEVDLPDPNGMLPGFSRARSYVPLSALGLTGSHDVDGHILSEFVTKAITDLVAMKDAHAFQAQPDLPTKAGADGVDTHTELADPTSKSRDGRCHICNEALQDLCSTCKETVTPLVAVYTSGKNKIHCKHVSGVCNVRGQGYPRSRSRRDFETNGFAAQVPRALHRQENVRDLSS